MCHICLAAFHGEVMGKKSKRQPLQVGGGQRGSPGSVLNSKAVCRVIDEIWTKTQGPSPTTLAGIWQEHDSIASLLRILIEKQGPSPYQLPPRAEGIVELEKWLDEHGTLRNNVEVHEFPEVGFGLRSKKDFQMGEKVLAIPHKVMMTSETAKIGPLGTLVSCDRMLQAMPNVALSLHLLNERYAGNSFWKPYIDVLPHSFTTPLYFTKEELHMLQVSPCLAEALQQMRNINKLYVHLHRVIRASADASLSLYAVGFHYEDFIWAVSCVMSRQNEILHPPDGKKTSLALIPFWDLCNHSHGYMGTNFNLEDRACDCYAMCATRAGEEFKIFYGPRSNAELFIHQGFVYPPNEVDSLKIKLGLSSAEEASTKSMRVQLLQRLGLPMSREFHLIVGDNSVMDCPFSPQLRAFVRVFTASPMDLQRYASLGDSKLRDVLADMQWDQTDTKALDFLEKRCALLLHCYKTTIEEDEQLLSKGQLSACALPAVQLRCCEKRLLRYSSHYALQTRLALEQVAATTSNIEVTATTTSTEVTATTSNIEVAAVTPNAEGMEKRSVEEGSKENGSEVECQLESKADSRSEQ